MKRLLLMLVMVAGTVGAWAAEVEMYYVWDEASKTITFYNDDQADVRPATDRVTYDRNNEATWSKADWIKEVEKAVFDASFATARPRRLSSWFANMELLTEIKGMENLNTSQATHYNSMFSQCKSLKSIDLSHFDTRKALAMYAVFSNCESLKHLDLSTFNTPQLESTAWMFRSCTSLESVNLSGLDTHEVTVMPYMFAGCKKLVEIDLSGFDTEQVKDMTGMFQDCRELQCLDLRSFNIAKVRKLSYMFADCENLRTIVITPETWIFGPASEYLWIDELYVFRGDVKLKGYKGTVLMPDWEDIYLCHLDHGPAGPGLLSEYVDYNLYIGGQQLNNLCSHPAALTQMVAEMGEEAMERYFTGEEMSVEFDGTTLMLDNVPIVSDYKEGTLISNMDSLIITVKGDCKIESTADYGVFINALDGNTTIVADGEGTLTLNAPSVGCCALNVFNEHLLTIGDNKGKLTLEATSPEPPLSGYNRIRAGKDVYRGHLAFAGENTVVRATATGGDNKPALANWIEVTLTDGLEYIEPEGARYGDDGRHSLYFMDGDEAVTASYCVISVPEDVIEPLRGDVNADGYVNATDLGIIVNIIAGLDNAANYDTRADLNADTFVNATDLGILVNIIAGIE